MTVKEAKQKIDNLTRYKNELRKLNDYCLGMHQSGSVKQARGELIESIAADADMSISLTNLAASVSEIIGDEIRRISAAVDAAEVNI